MKWKECLDNEIKEQEYHNPFIIVDSDLSPRQVPKVPTLNTEKSLVSYVDPKDILHFAKYSSVSSDSGSLLP